MSGTIQKPERKPYPLCSDEKKKKKKKKKKKNKKKTQKIKRKISLHAQPSGAIQSEATATLVLAAAFFRARPVWTGAAGHVFIFFFF